MIKEYNINDYLKDDKELQKAVIQELINENEKLKAEVEDLNFYIDSYKQVWEVDKYRKAQEEIKKLLKKLEKCKNKNGKFSLSIDCYAEEIEECLKSIKKD